MHPKCSVVCSTYGRWWLLEEMIASFLAQDYSGRLELVIVNDAPFDLSLSQTVHVPSNIEVSFLNLPEPAPSNPWKRDLGVAMSTGELCTYYDDDDIMLPHRFSSQVSRMRELKCDRLATHVAAVWSDGRFVELADNFFFCGHLWKRDFMVAGDERNREWDDVSAAARLDAAGACSFCINSSNWEIDDVVHVYRWGIGETHHSGIPGNLPAISKERAFKDSCRRHPKWPTSAKVEIVPAMKHDYASLCRQFLETKRRMN